MIQARRCKTFLAGILVGLATLSSPALANLDFHTQDPTKQLEIGYAYFTSTRGMTGNRVEAAKWFRKAAEQGDLRAINILGVLHVNGLGVPQDTVEAVRLFRKTAARGDTSGMFLLGASYITGDGVEQNAGEGARWIRKAAERGNAYAMEKLGLLYQIGQGVPQDNTQAKMWYSRSVQHGVNQTQLASLRFIGGF